MRDALVNHENAEIRAWCEEKGLPNGERELHRIFDKVSGEDSENAEILDRMSGEWQVVIDGGKTRVMRFTKSEINKQTRSIPEFLSFADFRNFYLNQRVIISRGNDEPDDHVPLGSWWLSHPARTQYSGLTFDPIGEEVIDGKLNLWQGFGVEPIAGDWSLMQQHIADVLPQATSEA